MTGKEITHQNNVRNHVAPAPTPPKKIVLTLIPTFLITFYLFIFFQIIIGVFGVCD